MNSAGYEFERLEAELEIDADMLMNRLSDAAQMGEGVTAKIHDQGMWISVADASFLYRACQVFKSK